MRFQDLEACPFCGCDEFYEKQQVRGTTTYRTRFDGEEADNEDMYESLFTTSSGRAYCCDCNKFLGNTKNNTVSKAAQRKCFENSLEGESQEVKGFFKKAIADNKEFQRKIKAERVRKW